MFPRPRSALTVVNCATNRARQRAPRATRGRTAAAFRFPDKRTNLRNFHVALFLSILRCRAKRRVHARARAPMRPRSRNREWGSPARFPPAPPIPVSSPFLYFPRAFSPSFYRFVVAARLESLFSRDPQVCPAGYSPRRDAGHNRAKIPWNRMNGRRDGERAEYRFSNESFCRLSVSRINVRTRTIASLFPSISVATCARARALAR